MQAIGLHLSPVLKVHRPNMAIEQARRVGDSVLSRTENDTKQVKSLHLPWQTIWQQRWVWGCLRENKTNQWLHCLYPLTFSFSCTPRRVLRCNRTCRTHPGGPYRGNAKCDERGVLWTTILSLQPNQKYRSAVMQALLSTSWAHKVPIRQLWGQLTEPLSGESLISNCRTSPMCLQ